MSNIVKGTSDGSARCLKSEIKQSWTLSKTASAKRIMTFHFYVADFSDVLYKCRYWKNKLPRVEPYYAVKCNSDPMLLSLLVSLGIRFDCASKGEIDAALAAGAEPSDIIIYAHPFKSNTFLRYAASSVNVDLMTFDCEQELVKIKRVFPQARQSCEQPFAYAKAIGMAKDLLTWQKIWDTTSPF
ncbi:ornithine decarboxylase [Caerostris extrusa]|uniref:ornithine decarboxylase n=1 Tax=Caerostris extrusa TaxID=172846 RepID=A0AAV4P892_CAEEX|nr:ornithine decarboxylase [Caerostris extrusa]